MQCTSFTILSYIYSSLLSQMGIINKLAKDKVILTFQCIILLFIILCSTFGQSDSEIGLMGPLVWTGISPRQAEDQFDE